MYYSVYQGRWSAAERDFEREILSMVRAEGMGLAPWGALGGGKFKTEEQRSVRGGRAVSVSEADIQVSKALEAVARRKNTLITSVAQAYVMHKAPYVFPIVGGRTIEHLKSNIEALTLALDETDVREIEAAAPFDVGFPSNFLYAGKTPDHPARVFLLSMAGHFDYVGEQTPIPARKSGE